MTFGTYTRNLRKARGLSQGDVAKALNLNSGQLVSNWERGACAIPLRKMKAVAKLYRVPVAGLFYEFKVWRNDREWKIVRKGGK